MLRVVILEYEHIQLDERERANDYRREYRAQPAEQRVVRRLLVEVELHGNTKAIIISNRSGHPLTKGILLSISHLRLFYLN